MLASFLRSLPTGRQGEGADVPSNTPDSADVGSDEPGRSLLEVVQDYLTDPELLAAKGIDWGGKLLAALAIVLVGRLVAKMLARTVRKLVERKADETLGGFVGSLAYMGLMAIVAMAGLEALGIDTTSFAAIIGAAAFAIGFALQGSLGNFAAGVMLLFFRPFKVGDYIEGGGISGSVLEIGVFNTVLKTPDNKRIIVPNSSITGGNIINYSAHDMRRVDLVFGIGYDDDIKQAKELLEAIVAEHPKVLADPEPRIAVSELADSSVNFVCRPWVRTDDYWDVKFDLTEEVKLRFDAADISIPFPQTDVHVHQAAS